MTPITRYKQDLTRADFNYDPAQEEAVEALQDLFDRLVANQGDQPSSGFFDRFRKKENTDCRARFVFLGWCGSG